MAISTPRRGDKTAQASSFSATLIIHPWHDIPMPKSFPPRYLPLAVLLDPSAPGEILGPPLSHFSSSNHRPDPLSIAASSAMELDRDGSSVVASESSSLTVNRISNPLPSLSVDHSAVSSQVKAIIAGLPFVAPGSRIGDGPPFNNQETSPSRRKKIFIKP